MTPTSFAAAQPADVELIAGFGKCSVANVSDNLDRLRGAIGLRPFHGAAPMAGRALTVPGRRGVQLVLRDGERLLISSAEPERLALALHSALGFDGSGPSRGDDR